MVRRFSTLAVITGIVVAAGATPALAHGTGERLDLGVPVSVFAGGVAALLVGAFVTVTARWTEPRLQVDTPGHPLDVGWVRSALLALRSFGIAAFAVVTFAGLFDGNDGFQNIAPVSVWVGFALIVPFASAAIGDIWRPMSPFRTITRWVNGSRPERVELAHRIGMWPATAVLLAFVWLQFVYPYPTKPITLGVAALAYVAWMVAVTRWAGVESGHTIGGAFHHFNGLISGIAPVRIGPPESGDGRSAKRSSVPSIRRRGWLRGLPQVDIRPGLGAFVITMIGGVVYDGLSATSWWGDLWGASGRTEWFGTIALASTVAVLYAIYMLTASTIGRLARSDRSARDLASSFAHVLVPIALGYSVAHYFTRVVFDGQQLLHAASDPFGYGWNLFGTADWRVEFWLSATAVWYIQLVVIVAAHLAALALTHDRALTEFEGPNVVRSEYGMLVLIVLLASLALFMLAG